MFDKFLVSHTFLTDLIGFQVVLLMILCVFRAVFRACMLVDYLSDLDIMCILKSLLNKCQLQTEFSSKELSLENQLVYS